MPSTLLHRLLVILLGSIIICNARPGDWEARCWPETEWSAVTSHELQNGEALVLFECPDGWQARLVIERIECSCGARSR